MRPSRPAPRPPRTAAKCSGGSCGRLWAPEAAGSGYKSAGEAYPKVWPAAARTGGGNCPPLAPVQNPAEPPKVPVGSRCSTAGGLPGHLRPVWGGGRHGKSQLKARARQESRCCGRRRREGKCRMV